ncbi:hypothetical protein FHS76_002577 [Ochrobactrum daejeonense]|uniref:DUF4169 family protein n=1 Tax=Brucella daejeonensis TaxID=659015 RepID=A0A7W9AY29_9HYPH|nr:DUF4169 family protein [Brucella daejeonensis]MBB5702693.1 hypothetical protein [Brucella daejeonensis]
MNDIVNLRQFRKQKIRESREKQAEQNRILHGRTKVEKDFARREEKKTEGFLDDNRLEKRDEPDAEK